MFQQDNGHIPTNLLKQMKKRQRKKKFSVLYLPSQSPDLNSTELRWHEWYGQTFNKRSEEKWVKIHEGRSKRLIS